MPARASSVRRAGARPSMRGARAVRVRVRRVPRAPPRPRVRLPRASRPRPRLPRALRPPRAPRARLLRAPRARPQPAPHGADAGVRRVANRAPGSRSPNGGSASCHPGALPGARGAPRASGCRPGRRPWRRPWSPSSERMPPACSACAMRLIRRRRSPQDAVPRSSEPRWTCLPDPDALASTVPIRLPRVQRINRDNRATLTRARFTDRLQPWSRNDNGILRFR